jgi:hypothetical protein
MIIAKLITGERIQHFETKRVKKNGEVFDGSVTVSPVRNTHGEIVGHQRLCATLRPARQPKRLCWNGKNSR